MSILITCPGKRVEMMNIFKKEFAKAGLRVIATGNSSILPALYVADKSYIVPSVEDDNYISSLIEICKKEKVKAILTMLDKDILVISKAKDEFRENGVLPIVVDYDVARVCDNKFSMYEFLVSNGFKCAKTYRSFEDFIVAYKNKNITFPVFVKPISGDGSRGATKCKSIEELKLLFSLNPNIIVQEFLEGPEYDIDAYIDIFNKKTVSIFAKDKLSKTIGGADKVKSINDKRIFDLTKRLARSLGVIGPIDIDIFNVNGEYYIGEINPRFGANYICAHACGVNFCELIVNNINGIENIPDIGSYKSGIIMMKYDKLLLKTKEEMLI